MEHETVSMNRSRIVFVSYPKFLAFYRYIYTHRADAIAYKLLYWTNRNGFQQKKRYTNVFVVLSNTSVFDFQNYGAAQGELFIVIFH